MKRLLLLMSFLLLLTSSQAQLFNVFGHDVGFIYVGPRVGMSMSKLSNWNAAAGYDDKFKYGYDFGIVGEFGFTNRFSINTEVNFVSKGIRQETDGFSSELKVNYIGIPLLAKLSFNVLGLKKIYAMGGTYQNIRTGGEFKMKSAFTQTESLVDSSWTRADWGLVLAVGAEYPTQYGIWALDVRYSQGFVDVHKSDDVKSRNQSIGFTLIYKYDLVDLLFKLKKNKSSKSSADETDTGTKKAKGLKVEER